MDEPTLHPDPDPQIKLIDARELLGDATRVGLMLDGMLYMLRLTRNGKLILTK
ncbi:hemin uptake protein HemP [Nereida sp. MMG025]|uniref:hemin uptake protein HemP n=1 Tax=Nereida sp. MMG025 TaxID=2909981 RepID=UPI001F424D4E|nr:hemin uptake protein HemP [Nereida sp. MMG025]MCF6445268.1 hemin uptake protein HemP [Nereida sp. MMG025]